ncbi:MAG: IscS subfamily cysteine desulfurase [Endomicrobiales bacterium]|nr:IscS subfamily cysteine desulfurase [Endomicrobiales bacterium]
MNKIYLDHSATTPLKSQVLEAMLPYFSNSFGNPSSAHGFGQEALNVLAKARAEVAGILNAQREEEIIFTSGGTESDNMALKGVAYARKNEGRHIITTQIEHHAILSVCEQLEKEGFSITFVAPQKDGCVSAQSVINAIRPDTILVSVMHANNETGALEPVEEIANVLEQKNILRQNSALPQIYIHTDAVQSAGKITLDVQKLKVNMLSLSAHKFYGPKGIGVLYVKSGTKIIPLMQGGHQERNIRPGTENIPSIVGLSAALKLCVQNMQTESLRLAQLRDRLENGVLSNIKKAYVNANKCPRLGNVTSISFEAIEAEALLVMLDMAGIAVSTGSACASGSQDASHVLRAMGVDPALARGTVRFSLGAQNTQEQIEYVLKTLPEFVAKLRAMSPMWKS